MYIDLSLRHYLTKLNMIFIVLFECYILINNEIRYIGNRHFSHSIIM